MNRKPASLALAIALGAGTFGVAGIATAQEALTAPQVQAKLAAQGYTSINDVEFEDGMWKADAKSADGNHMEVHLDAKTGKIYPESTASRLSKEDVRASLETQGYTDVHDVDFEDGLWQAKADNAAGNKVKLRVDAKTGKVIGTD